MIPASALMEARLPKSCYINSSMYRVSQKKHSYKIFGLKIMLFTCSQTFWSGLRSSFTKWGSAGVHHSLQDYYVCEQVKSMISSPKIL